MSNPRIIATTTSAALIAAVGAGAAVYAVEIATSANDTAAVSGTQAEQAPSLQQGQDDSTTVYRAPSEDDEDWEDDDDSRRIAPAPADTQWQQQSTTPKGPSNTSKSS